jgi:hypothetical protein
MDIPELDGGGRRTLESDHQRLPEEAEGLPEAFRHGNQMRDEIPAREGCRKGTEAGTAPDLRGIAIRKPIV